MKEAGQDSSADIVHTRKSSFTKLQAGAILSIVMVAILFGVGSMVLESQDSRPSENLFQNAQTLSILEA